MRENLNSFLIRQTFCFDGKLNLGYHAMINSIETLHVAFSWILIRN